MTTLEDLEIILEMSVNKNGEIPLTNRHLLNIVRMAILHEEENNRLTEEETGCSVFDTF